MNKYVKKGVVVAVIASLVLTLFFYPYMGLNLKNEDDRGRLDCIKTAPFSLPPEAYEYGSIFFIPANYSDNLQTFALGSIYLSFLLGIPTVTCGLLLIKSLKNHAKQTTSFTFSKTQQKLTRAVLGLMLMEVFAVIMPAILLFGPPIFFIYIPYISFVCTIVVSIHLITGSLWILIASPAYENIIIKLIRIFLPIQCLKIDKNYEAKVDIVQLRTITI
ncbi:unnamed protein product [Auanema sp. JU1783]|nr:unnamed protein product [Auanema sp. JU1783]